MKSILQPKKYAESEAERLEVKRENFKKKEERYLSATRGGGEAMTFLDHLLGHIHPTKNLKSDDDVSF